MAEEEEEEDLSEQGMRLRFSNASDMQRVAAFLLSDQRCEMMGVLGMTDTALLREMLQFFTPTDRWDAATAAQRAVVSPDTRRVSANQPWNGCWANAKSVNSTDDFTVRVTNHHSRGRVVIGFATRGVFVGKWNTSYLLEVGGMYAYCPMECWLMGSGKYGEERRYGAQPATPQCTVRCVADRRCGTIRFYLDGVDCGVAWTDVPPEEPLYAVAMFYRPGISVEFV